MLNAIPVLSKRIKVQRGLFFGILIIAALIAFEVFNYSTTDFALSDLLGELTFLSVRWSTILAIAFCGIDFAGIARLFTPEKGSDEPAEIWYLFGAWMLAALMNAMLTWWGVSIAILNHETLGNAVVARETLLNVVPIFVAVMVWLIRVLIIGSISMAGDRLFSQETSYSSRQDSLRPSRRTSSSTSLDSNRGIRPGNNAKPTPVKSGIKASSYQRQARRYTTNKSDSTVITEPEYTPLESNQPIASFSSNQNNNRVGQVRF